MFSVWMPHLHVGLQSTRPCQISAHQCSMSKYTTYYRRLSNSNTGACTACHTAGTYPKMFSVGSVPANVQTTSVKQSSQHVTSTPSQPVFTARHLDTLSSSLDNTSPGHPLNQSSEHVTSTPSQPVFTARLPCLSVLLMTISCPCCG